MLIDILCDLLVSLRDKVKCPIIGTFLWFSGYGLCHHYRILGRQEVTHKRIKKKIDSSGINSKQKITKPLQLHLY